MTDEVLETPRAQVGPHTVLLIVLGLAGMLVAIVLTVVANGVTTRSWDEVGDEELLAALTLWTQIAATIGIVALVGAVVLAGVAETVRRTTREIVREAESAPDPDVRGSESTH
ncbi:MAG: hypothetical protein ABWX92_07045 [Mycetocola sp.]